MMNNISFWQKVNINGLLCLLNFSFYFSGLWELLVKLWGEKAEHVSRGCWTWDGWLTPVRSSKIFRPLEEIFSQILILCCPRFLAETSNPFNTNRKIIAKENFDQIRNTGNRSRVMMWRFCVILTRLIKWNTSAGLFDCIDIT